MPAEAEESAAVIDSAGTGATTEGDGSAEALLRRARERANLTQAQLAGATGLSVRALRDLEHGRVGRIRTSTVDRLAAALDLGEADRARLRSIARPQARVEVLGPVRISGTAITSEARRSVLALLALQPGEVVHVDEIIDVLWADRPPASCRTQVHGHIGALRSLLEPQRTRNGPTGVLQRYGDGYRLDLDEDRSDVLRFRGLIALAYNEKGETAMDRYAQALRCWRGPVAADTLARLRQHPTAVGLAAQRVQAALDWADLAIERAARDMPPVLRELAHDEPFHEGLHARLMLALAACGEQAAALAVFEDLRSRLADQLGVAPSDELTAAHIRVLRQQVTTSRYVPAQLPGEAGVFVGRAEQLRRLDAMATTVCAITGGAGVGKTALALRWAHRMRDRFPDGQMYMNLRGHASSTTAEPLDVLTQMLADLGVPAGEVPSSVDAAAALFRTVVADRRILVLLDDAHDADQVRPLLPGGPGCLALITSRHRLDGLIAYDGALRLSLDVLPADDSVALLSQVLGADRVAREPAAVRELADICSRLPLALRIAAAHLSNRPRYAIRSYVAALSTEDTLAHLEVPGDERTAVRVAFAASYRRLSPAARSLFALLGSAPPIEIDALAAALNLGQSLTYRHHGQQALPHLRRAMRLSVEADWAEGQSASLNALAHLYLVAGQPRQATVYLRRGIEVNRQLGRRTAQAKQLSNLGLVSIDLGRLAEARECFTQALATHRSDGHTSDEVGPLNGLIDVLVRLGAADEAIAYARESIAICHEYGRSEAGSTALARLSAAYRILGRLDLARTSAEQAHALAVENDGPRTIAHALVELALLDSDDPDRAARRFAEALALLRAGGSAAVRADAHVGLAAVELARCRVDASVAQATEALDMSRRCDYRPGVAQARLALARAYAVRGDDSARPLAQQALRAFRTTGHRVHEEAARAFLGSLR